MLLLAVLYVAMASCATIPPPDPVISLPSSQQTIQRLEERRHSVRSFSMAGGVWVEGPDGGLDGDHLIQGAYPDRLRAQFMGPFGQPVMLLVCNGVRLMVLDYKAQMVYAGTPSRANLARFFGLELSVNEIYALLSGNMPLLPYHQAQVAPADKAGQARLELLGPGGAVGQGVDFALSDFAALGGWLKQWGRQNSFSCRFEDLVKRGPGRFPLRIELSDDRGREVVFDNDTLDINLALSEGVFDVTPPPGLEVRHLP